MLVLLFVALWFILRGDLLYLLQCVILFLCFSVLLVLLGEERANLSAFRTFCLICACLDLSVSSSSWCLGRAAVCDCGTPWTFLLPFFSVYPTPNSPISIPYSLRWELQLVTFLSGKYFLHQKDDNTTLIGKYC